MFGNLKDNFFTKKARMNFEVYGQNSPITPEAGGKKAPFLKENQFYHQNSQFGRKLSNLVFFNIPKLLKMGTITEEPNTVANQRMKFARSKINEL